MKKTLLVALALLATGCTTVRTYDKDGNILGTCRVSGITKRGGTCVGRANGEAAVR